MSDPEATVQLMIAEACFGRGSLEAFTTDLRAFLADHGVSGEDADAIVAAPPRLALYRRLIRNNLVGVASQMMPRTRARLNALASGAFDAAFDAFLATQGPRTHYLRDVPAEFLAWATPRWTASADIPAYATDLAMHELAEFQVAALPAAEARPPLGELALDRPLVLAEAQRLMRYRFAVHELPEDVGDRSEPEARPVSLLVYRDADDALGSMELSPIAARIFESLVAKLPLGQALTDALLADAATLLATLGEEGVLLGASG